MSTKPNRSIYHDRPSARPEQYPPGNRPYGGPPEPSPWPWAVGLLVLAVLIYVIAEVVG